MKIILTTLTFMFFLFGIQTLQAQQKALHHTELAKYLPPSIKDYFPKEETEGTTFESNDASYSTVSQSYEKDDLEINLVLIDYAQAEGIYEGMTMPWSMGMSIDTNEEKANGINVNGFPGWEVYDKKENNASIILGVHDRYIFSAECNDCDTEFLKDIAQSLNLKSLPQ